MEEAMEEAIEEAAEEAKEEAKEKEEEAKSTRRCSRGESGSWVAASVRTKRKGCFIVCVRGEETRDALTACSALGNRKGLETRCG